MVNVIIRRVLFVNVKRDKIAISMQRLARTRSKFKTGGFMI